MQGLVTSRNFGADLQQKEKMQVIEDQETLRKTVETSREAGCRDERIDKDKSYALAKVCSLFFCSISASWV